jgi:hypothetical protein
MEQYFASADGKTLNLLLSNSNFKIYHELRLKVVQ